MMKAVLFDYDGTLMNTNEVVLQSWEEAYRKMGKESPGRTALRATFGEPLDYSMKKLFPDVDYRVPMQYYRTYNVGHFLELVEPFPYVLKALKEVRKRGIKTALVTARLKRTTYMGLERFEMAPLFDAIITEEDCHLSKPNPAPVYAALEKMGLLPAADPDIVETKYAGEMAALKDRVLMIGDTKHDMECCRNAGIRSALVSHSEALTVKSKDPLVAVTGQGEEAYPDYLVESLEDILAIVDSPREPA